MLVNGETALGKQKMYGGEQILLDAPPPPEISAFTAEDIPFPVVYEDEHLLVIDKPAGLVVHPAAGNWSGTLLNGLLHYCPSLTQLPRAVIVHRLDKDTSGLMVVAKTQLAQTDLVRQLQARTVKRHYRAVADGLVRQSGAIDAAIGRDPRNRLKMAVVNFGGKPAVTHVEVVERLLAGQPATAHWGYLDPSAVDGTDAQKIEAFRQTMLALKRRLDLLISLPPEKLEKTLLQRTARDLSKA